MILIWFGVKFIIEFETLIFGNTVAAAVDQPRGWTDPIGPRTFDQELLIHPHS